MTEPLSFDHLQAILPQHVAGLPDFRKPSPNTRYQIPNVALGAFGIFFTQSPSSLEYQQRLKQSQGQDNAQTLFGVQDLPCDNQVRNWLDPFSPSYFNLKRSVHRIKSNCVTLHERQGTQDVFQLQSG